MQTAEVEGERSSVERMSSKIEFINSAINTTPKIVPLVYIAQTARPKQGALLPPQPSKMNTNKNIAGSLSHLLAPGTIPSGKKVLIQKSGGGVVGGTHYLTMLQPVTATTSTTNVEEPASVVGTNKNSTNTGKIAFLPLTLSDSKMYNIRISDGKVQQVVKDANPEIGYNSNSNIVEMPEIERVEKEYELSIADEEKSLNNAEPMVQYTSGQIMNVSNHLVPLKIGTKHGISILKKCHETLGKYVNIAPKISDDAEKPNKALKAESSEASEKQQKQQASIIPHRRKANITRLRECDANMEISTTLVDSPPETPIKKQKRCSSPTNSVGFSSAASSSPPPEPSSLSPSSSSNSSSPIPSGFSTIGQLDDEEFDAKRALNWAENGIATLPGSVNNDLRFVLNEFDLLEYVPPEEYNKLLQKQMKQAGGASGAMMMMMMETSNGSELQCIQCGCYGQPSDFETSKYCSVTCKKKGKNADEVNGGAKNGNNNKKRGKRAKLAAPESGSDNESTATVRIIAQNSHNNLASNESSQDRVYSYPWTCSKKGFSWSKYLDHIKAKSVPVKLFKDPFPYDRNRFRAGMKLEGVDPLHPSHFCVLSVAETEGYRIRLHFDGYPNNYDFWVNADSMNVFPVGWCEKHGHVLQPPGGTVSGPTANSFNWMAYLKMTKSTAAPKQLFLNRGGNAICPNGFRVGMKLEAVDKKNNSLVCVATVKDMMDNRILVHFDSWDDIYDYWCDPTSPYIHPVGWCDQYGHKLTPPNDYPHKESFSWSKYLKDTKSVAAPVRAFKTRPASGFRPGMRLECVDRRVPQIIRVATVADVRDHQLRIQFDGWPDRYSYWVDDDNEDIHPVGWCHKTGHQLETPLTPDDVYDFLECPTVGCRGIGHIKGAEFASHSEQVDCPYAEANIDIEKILPDRLMTPDKRSEAVVPLSIIPKEKMGKKVGRPPKIARFDSIKSEPSSLDEKPKRKYKKRVKISRSDIEESDDNNNDDDDDDDDDDDNKLKIVCDPIEELSPPTLLIEQKIEQNSPKEKGQKKDNEEEHYEDKHQIQRSKSLIDNSKIEPAMHQNRPKHIKYLNKFLKKVAVSQENPRSWIQGRVESFVHRIPGCASYVKHFRHLRIDGEAFLSLNMNNLLKNLHMKVGHAIKLYNIIVLLRQNVTESSFT